MPTGQQSLQLMGFAVVPGLYHSFAIAGREQTMACTALERRVWQGMPAATSF